MIVYRVTVEKYPTDDGKPFIDQSAEFWRDMVERRALNNEDPEVPSWIPDLTDWTCQFVHMEGTSYPKERGAFIEPDEEDGTPLLVVPAIKRRHFFARAAAAERVRQFLAWGCIAYVETATTGEFTQ